jgi:small GTP-binding protein
MSFIGNNSLVNESSSSSQIENYKIVIIGDQHVGKTSILSRYKYEVVETAYAPTVGIDFLTKNVYLEDKTIRLIMWDTAGQERFKSLIPSYLKNANCIILTYDISNKLSFLSINKWLKDSKEYVSENTLFVVCGNKLDLKRAVSKKEVEDFVKEKNIPIFVEVSALSGEGINELFISIIKHFSDNIQLTSNEIKSEDINDENDIKSQAFTLKEKNNKNEVLIVKKKKKGCCK